MNIIWIGLIVTLTNFVGFLAKGDDLKLNCDLMVCILFELYSNCVLKLSVYKNIDHLD